MGVLVNICIDPANNVHPLFDRLRLFCGCVGFSVPSLFFVSLASAVFELPELGIMTILSNVPHLGLLALLLGAFLCLAT
ncbi:hypothetical protein B0T20DRAFT_203748 [Sordaria brevicollis]|uniref:Uncharacterized protein n=1 Tax=Sordaria brevicollis TaxID=83679 RepID=A0AAE0PE13_SORBR|nr:hypothetical protein B0T20DRAFT_203748 [Sordaria brevicollis]